MKKYFSVVIILALVIGGCSVYQTLTNLSRLQFKVGQVDGFKINGISISGKSKLSDFNPLDLINLSAAFAKGSLPASFVLNVEAKNPNDGTGGYQKSDATLQNFKWRLFLDDKETVSGELDQPVTVPGTGNVTTIPLRINLDLVKFFEDRGYESIINLALALGGVQGSSSKITLFATPTVSSPFGNITYPGELKLVDTQFSK
ncbi:MAG TPA: hypothetical protein PK073_08480 [Ignavibacteriaceae bacterium]|jgi:hypothetical protein|nr:MAG: hypothetical protein BWY38_01851 [Ignavibacteria bacterium ADurb.Bin266]OQY74513.1 MAG: hypothetical protein B6D44_04165 [Ignavibacteriales bacterium UTCHB2]HQF42938.1 hypothetical protein [Ignavibacteriaceae bacterium]HQI41812.1 hypothetical protein [Ignavibacteriaceae bacterium]HQJ46660.1 hypothetical protein [Ignavibacteriaceae bacterium]